MSDRIPINSGGEGARRPPAISLRSVGHYVDVAVINEEKAPAYVYGTNERAETKDGRPKTKDVLTVLVIRGTGVLTDPKSKVERPIEAGEVATIHVEGQTRWDPDSDKTRAKGEFKSWSGAKEDHGQLCVGDVVRWTFEVEVPGKGAQPRKVRPFKLREPRPEEAAQTERCKQLHREGTAIPVGAGAPDEESW